VKRRKKFDAALKEILKDASWQDRQKLEKVANEQWRKKWGNRPALKGDELLALMHQVIGKGSPQQTEREVVMNEFKDERQHNLKTWPEFFEALFMGKNFEIRKADRDFRVGDRLLLQEWSDKVYPGGVYTGREVKAIISWITPLAKVPNMPTGDNPGFVVLGLQFEDALTTGTLPRPLAVFARFMYFRLLINMKKGPLDNISLTGGQILDQIRVNIHELQNAMNDRAFGNPQYYVGQIIKKAADAANYILFAFMQSGELEAQQNLMEPKPGNANITGVCNECGCTEERGCPVGGPTGTCFWVDEEKTLCSKCADTRPEKGGVK
jgi:hypothetical protein